METEARMRTEMINPINVGRRMATLVVMTVFVAACTASPPALSPSATASSPTTGPSPSPTADPLAEPSLDGRFVVDDEGRELAITCWGREEPTIVLEGGDPYGRDNFTGSQLVRALVGDARVCLYDRAGGGDSDPAPNEKRDFDDVVDDLHALLAAAHVDGPKVLVGSSFGGDLVANFTARHPEDVIGVVLIDTPAPEDFTVKEFPEGAWDYPGNVEHIDFFAEFVRKPFDAPLLVITASDGQSSVEDQRVWLPLSPDSRQVELSGGHDLHEEDPGAVAAEILSFISAPSSDILGYWHRAQTCGEMLNAFTAAGLAESHRGWLQGNFYGGEEGPGTGNACAGAAGPLEHSHWFTAEGGFGSHDENGEEVDGGDFVLVDEDTLSFPSHASEFGYDGEVFVQFAIGADGLATFIVELPDECDAACEEAHAWALSAFSSGRWARGDVP
jgi:pimeloyl-ACP methyl ester carboxylesterase